MATKQDWSIDDWRVTFFDEYAGDLHPSFRQKLVEQLFEKGSAETGIPGFEKYDFMLLIGQDDLQLQQVEDNMCALISFITPPAYSLRVWIYWKAAGKDIATIHKKNVSKINIEFHWGRNFPLNEVLPYLKPYKKEKKGKTKLHFDTDYYHNAFPDISLEIIFAKSPKKKQLEDIDKVVYDFIDAWHKKNKNKPINHAGSLTKKDKNVFQIMIDFGVDNSLKTVSLLLKEISGKVEPDLINKVLVK